MGFNKLAGDQLPAAELNSFYASAGLYGASSAGSDAYAITVTPIPNDYDAGDTYTFKADVANTGAATLNVNSLGAKTIKKFGSLDLETGDISAGQMVTVRYDGTNFQLNSEARPSPFFYQELPISTGAYNSSNPTASSIVSNPDGSILLTWYNTTLTRYERDSLVGTYKQTHRVTTTLAQNSQSANSGLAILGNYIYLFADGGTNVSSYRHDLANLSNATAMTFGTVIPAAQSGSPNPEVFIQNGFIYVNETNTNTFHKLSVSGTAFTTVTTITPTANLRGDSGGYLTDSNGTLWAVKDNGVDIVKATSADAASETITTINMDRQYLDNENTGTPRPVTLIPIDSTRMYLVSFKTTYFGNTSPSYYRHFLIFRPISKP